MNQEKLDRWGEVASSDRVVYVGRMAEIQAGFQRASLHRLDDFLKACGCRSDVSEEQSVSHH